MARQSLGWAPYRTGIGRAASNPWRRRRVFPNRRLFRGHGLLATGGQSQGPRRLRSVRQVACGVRDAVESGCVPRARDVASIPAEATALLGIELPAASPPTSLPEPREEPRHPSAALVPCPTPVSREPPRPVRPPSRKVSHATPASPRPLSLDSDDGGLPCTGRGPLLQDPGRPEHREHLCGQRERRHTEGGPRSLRVRRRVHGHDDPVQSRKEQRPGLAAGQAGLRRPSFRRPPALLPGPRTARWSSRTSRTWLGRAFHPIPDPSSGRTIASSPSGHAMVSAARPSGGST